MASTIITKTLKEPHQNELPSHENSTLHFMISINLLTDIEDWTT